MIKLAIFDLDGTLVNSLDDLANATNYALKKHNYPTHELAKYRYFVGDGVPMLIKRALPQEFSNDETVLAVKKDFSEYYNKNYAIKTRPYDGILDLIKALKSDGIKIAVASNKPDNFTKEIVKIFFKADFDFAQGNTEIIPKKPSPEIVFAAQNAIGATKSETVFVGDTNVDIYTAKAANVTSIGCLWGFREYNELSEARADYIISKPMEIYKIIKDINLGGE
ncbi:MAG: HAD family hydrolase [Oscillospiraceae bacterium]